MGRARGRSWAWVAATAVGCSPLPEDPQSQKDEEASAPKKAPKSEKSARASCEGAPLPLGRSGQRPSLKFPGPISALAQLRDSLWVCSLAPRDQGYLAEVRRDNQGQYRILRSLTLKSPCRGLSPAQGGLAIWLRGWDALWYSADRLKNGLESPQYLSLGSISPSQFDPEWTIRAQWVPEQQAFYVAAGGRGLIRLEKKEDKLEFDRSFVGPKQFARDLAQLGSALIVADPQAGLVAWSPSEQVELGRWHDTSRKGPTWVQRVSVQGQKLAVAAGPAGAYLLSAKLQPDGLSFGLLEREQFNESLHLSAWSDKDPWWASSGRLWDSQGKSQRRLPGMHGRGVLRAISPGRSGGLWVAQGDRIEYFDKLHPDSQISIIPQSSFSAVHEQSSGEFPFLVRGEGSLWVQAPKIRGGEGLSLELENWPEHVAGCPDLYHFKHSARVTVRVLSGEEGEVPSQAQLRLRSSDPELGELRLDIVRDSPSSAQLIGRALPNLDLARWSDGTPGPRARVGQWQWLEYMNIDDLGTPSSNQRIESLRELLRSQARNGAFRLRVSVIVGGGRDRVNASTLNRLASQSELLSGLDFYFDERYDGHRVVPRTRNGRFYPLRVLVDPQGKIRYIDQNPGLATATGHFLTLREAR